MVEVIFVRIWFALVGVFDKLGRDGGMGGGGSGDSEICSNPMSGPHLVITNVVELWSPTSIARSL